MKLTVNKIETGRDVIRFARDPWEPDHLEPAENLRVAAKNLRAIAKSVDGMAAAHEAGEQAAREEILDALREEIR